MELNLDTFGKIEAYLLHQLPDKEYKEFEAEIQANDELRKEVNLQRKLIEGIEEEFMKEKIRGIYENQIQKKNTIKLWYYPIAASIVFIISIGIYYYFKSTPEEKIYYALHDELDTDLGPPNLMSSGTTDAFQAAMEAYREEDYQKAIDRLEPLHKAASVNDTISYYLGLSYLEEKQAQNAIKLLEEVNSSSNKLLANKAKWYLALAYLKTGKVEMAKDLFSEIANSPGQFREEKAKKALKLLEELGK